MGKSVLSMFELLLVKWYWVLLGSLVILTFSAMCFGLTAVILVRLPATYFSEPLSQGFCVHAHPALRWTGLILKNISGAAIVALGIVLAMPGIPGPGALVVLLGLMLMDFPGKRRLEWCLVSRPGIFAKVNYLRQRFCKAPLVLK
jgi:hypothetical protein